MKLSDNTRIWLHGLGAAFIGASATSISTIVVAPAVFNLSSLSGAGHVVLVSAVSGCVSAAGYLAKSPLPPLQTQVEREEKIVGPDGGITQKSSSTTITQGPTS